MFPQIVLKNKKVIDQSFSESDLINLLLKNRQIKKSNQSDFFKPHFPSNTDFNIYDSQLLFN